MAQHVYKKIEVTGTSKNSVEEAVQRALTHAGKTVHNLRWFEVTEIRGAIDGTKVGEYQVTLKIGFTLDNSEG